MDGSRSYTGTYRYIPGCSKNIRHTFRHLEEYCDSVFEIIRTRGDMMETPDR